MSRQLFHTPLRRAHAITPFGVGSILLTRNRVSAVVCGPTTWLRSMPSRPPGSVSILDELTITDRHLQVACGVQRFVMPWAAGDHPSTSVDWLIPAVRFPLAEHCANPNCQRMVRRERGDASEGRCEQCAPLTSNRGRWPTFQVPVVLACKAGHLADLDWSGWLHSQPGPACAQPKVGYQPSASSDRPYLNCLGCERSAGFDPDVDFPCGGQRPWLPQVEPEACSERARPLERTSVSAYYAWQLSSLTIPVAGADNPALLHALNDNPVLRPLRNLEPSPDVVAQMVAAARRLGIDTDHEEVDRHLHALANEQPRGPRREDELDALTSTSHPRRATAALPDLVVEPQDVAAYRGSRLGDLLAGVSLVPRLRETRVLAGFSRLEPTDPNPHRGYAQMWGKEKPQHFGEHAKDDWLPGYQVFGEGILLVLDPAAVTSWTSAAASSRRAKDAAEAATRLAHPQVPMPWLLAHTLAHLMMRALAPHAGYPLPALRERIFAVDDRTGLLVYTAAGDVHGTLGGLVELGSPERLGSLMEAALDAAAWCATDPVCGEDGHGSWGTGTAPGACHHCMLVPETSCESFNKGLDRGVIHGHQNLPGFISRQLSG